MFYSANKQVATKPFPPGAVEAQKSSSGFVTAAPRQNLVALEVVMDDPDLGVAPGNVVWVPREYANFPFGKTRFNIPGVGEFVLIPHDKVMAIETKAPSTYADLPGV